MMTALSITAALAGLLAALALLILIVASAPNTTPAQLLLLKTLSITTVGIAIAALAGAASALLVARPGLAAILGLIPFAWCIIALIVMTVMKDGRASAGSPIAQWIAMLIFTALGGMLLVVGLRETYSQAVIVRTAEEVEARILETAVTKSTSADTDRRINRDNSTTTYEPTIRFEYTFRGERYESTHLRPTIIVQTYPSADSAAAVLAPFPPDTTVPAWVSPRYPDRAYLIPLASPGPAIYLTLGLAIPSLVYCLARLVL